VLQNLSIKIVGRAGESDQLFGSVTSRDIAAEIEKQGYSVDRHKIFLDRPIRLVGDHEVKIHLHRDIDITLLVKVRAEGREDEEIVAKAETAEVEEEAVEAETETEAVAAEEAEPKAEAKPDKKSAQGAKKADAKRAKKHKDEE
jgi:large subunit ribosomal protein L9